MSKLFVISAPSGAGKTSLIESLLENSPLKNLKLGISCTTRAKRENEVNGESYFFTTKNVQKNPLIDNKLNNRFSSGFGISLRSTPASLPCL